ncbi:hypothetical protein [Chamaesiphon minutus]|nr:hypothetical protein [Chamaesiphon minutus]
MLIYRQIQTDIKWFTLGNLEYGLRSSLDEFGARQQFGFQTFPCRTYRH